MALVAGVGPQWMPEVDSDDDGYVRQKSFMTSSQIEIDPATGEEIGESKDIQGFIASGVGVGGSGRKPWEGEMFRSILDAPLPEDDDIPDEDLLASFPDKVQQQVGVSPTGPIEAVDQLWAVIAIGLGQPGIGLKRDSRCPECGLEWNQHPGTLTACEHCNGLVHEGCAQIHERGHMTACLYKGLRRKEAGRKTAQKTQEQVDQ